ncbi:pre-mRNA-splicing factor cwc22 [Paracoccidioides brasiliensis Pb18]|uniref:Pre-mRNA-splicing factor CWC22 n=1 Tax=Paracoccidioides brasiliensis (strain Pb18) TaxID=502780 RepID=C1GKH6_PARBD|nr:pre-mRNA-splicing factor cwc22 [Paracoccidioides brasiliensis Pb18]EEH42942.2 pre-mRNA-splicing factor cwc22 [Paracoccidioides brasiliensis Pb18]
MEDPMMLQSAVRLPTPPPGVSFSPQPLGARKRSPPSRSPSPDRRRSPPNGFSRDGPHGPYGETDRSMDRDREQQLAERLRKRDAPAKALTEEEKQAAAKAEYEKLLNMRSGGTYIPPAKLRALQAQITDKTSKEYQRMAWEALKKSINGLINKVNVSNIKHIVPELFGENLVRGRGLFCRSIMKAQAASLPFTPIYAAMAAIVNTKLPQVGELLLNRLIVQFRKAFKRNDKAVCISSTTFIAHLCNQQVAHEMVAAQILLLLLHKPTDDSVEIAVGLTREVGQFLEEMGGPIALAVFDQFRNILHEADIDKRVQYMIEVLFQVRKDHYKDNPAIKEELDLVEEEDQITHRVSLDDEIDVQDGLNIFKYDAQWEEHETAYKKLKAEILGEVSDEEDDDEEGTDDSSDEEEEDEQDKQMDIKDQSNTDLVNLRRTIYLTIMSSIDFEECCHKLIKITLPPGQESELPSMIIECCSQERTYSKFYGLIGERFAKLNRLWADLYEAAFVKYYETIHRYETNRLRNIAKFFGHMFSSDAIGWHALSIVHLNEEETTSSSRIFIKILFQELTEVLGMTKLQATLNDEILKPSFEGLFPTDNPRNTRFSINYFTSIGMGVLTEGMREHLKNMPKPSIPALPARAAESDSESVSSYSSYSSYTGTSRSRSYSRSRSPSRGRRRSGSRTRSPSSMPRSPGTSRSRSRDRSYTPSRSRSRSPPTRRRGRQPSYSRSPSPASRRSRSVSYSPVRRRSPPTRRDESRGKALAGKRSSKRSPPLSATPPRSRGQANGTGRRARNYSVSSYSRSPSPPPRSSRGRRRHSSSPSPSPSPSRSRSRSRSRFGSCSPPPRKQQKDGRDRSRHRSITPPPRTRTHRGRSKNRHPSVSPHRSPSPPPRKQQKDGRNRSRHRSITPPPRTRTHRGRSKNRHPSVSPHRSPSPSPRYLRRDGTSRSRSPRRSVTPQKRGRVQRGGGGGGGRRRSFSRSRSRSRSPSRSPIRAPVSGGRARAADFL